MKKVILVILDGWGIGNKSVSDTIFNSNTPVMDKITSQNPFSTLVTFGEDVGLPEGQMGNSEVGHMNIGSGRIVFQDLGLINKECKKNLINNNKVLLDTLKYVKENNVSLHLMGLVSDGGVHSHYSHLVKLSNIAQEFGLKNVFIHSFLDGRDTNTNMGIEYMKRVIKETENNSSKVASIIGRYYAMDRDKRWDRIKLAYDMLTKGIGEKYQNPIKAIEDSYKNNITDEFLLPKVMIDNNQKPIGLIKPKDAVICFNFRTDRCRQITMALTQENYIDYQMSKMDLYYTTMTRYDDKFKNVNVMYDKLNLVNTLGEVLAKNNKLQLRAAETEKYPHVTFFFNGGEEKVFNGEERIMVNSPKVTTYDLKPEMSAIELKDKVKTEILKNKFDFICLNFANPDMVGHTGVIPAIKKAVETTDMVLGEIIEAGISKDYQILVIADHGNSDCTINEDGTPNTSHTTNPVPCILLNTKYKKIENGKLADIAPTILTLMDISIPKEMDGKILIK